MIHARETATVTAQNDQFTITMDGETAALSPAPPERSTDYRLYAVGTTIQDPEMTQ